MLYSKRILNGAPSIFLDGIRFSAALVVLVTHCRAVWFPEGEQDALPSNLSHGAVVIFFVLSGFVIAHTTSSSKRSASEYAVARLTRLYSIFLPAILITLLCALFIHEISPNIYQKYQQHSTALRYAVSLFFCNEIWFLSSAPLINGPIWSLSYEFWYYVIFGAFFYRKSGLKGYIFPLAVCLIAGPKILLLMIMWMIGWGVYHLPKSSLNNKVAWISIFFLLSISIYLAIFLPSIPNSINTTNLHWADKFISDFIISFIIGLIFYLLPYGTKATTYSIAIRWFRKLADLTFPIYVLHFPLLVLSESILPHIFTSKFTLFWCSIVSVFIVCSTIGLFLEKFKSFWTSLFSYVIKALEKKIHFT